MDSETLQRFIETQDTLFDLTASVMAIRETLYKAKITDPQAMKVLFQEARQKIDNSPAGQGLQVARTALENLKDFS